MNFFGWFLMIATAFITGTIVVSSPQLAFAEDATVVEFSGTSLLEELKAAMREDRSVNEVKTGKAIAAFSKVLAAWNPSASQGEIAAVLTNQVAKFGVNVGLIEPSLVFIDMSLFHGREDFAGAVTGIVSALNPKMGDILERGTGIKALSFERQNNLQPDFRSDKSDRTILGNSETGVPGTPNGPQTRDRGLNQIMFGSGSVDAEQGPRRQGRGIRETPTPIMGRHVAQEDERRPNKRSQQEMDKSPGDIVACYSGCVSEAVQKGVTVSVLVRSPNVKIATGVVVGLGAGGKCIADCHKDKEPPPSVSPEPAQPKTPEPTSEPPPAAPAPESKSDGGSGSPPPSEPEGEEPKGPKCEASACTKDDEKSDLRSGSGRSLFTPNPFRGDEPVSDDEREAAPIGFNIRPIPIFTPDNGRNGPVIIYGPRTGLDRARGAGK